jgi:Flp pilus assembly protein TadD
VAAARQAVAIAPDAVVTQMELGDTLTAMGRKDEARTAYARAMVAVKTMESGAREDWEAQVQKKVAAL